MKKKKYKIAFLDRDGVLNKNINGGYVGYPKDFRWVNGAIKTIKFLKKEGFKIIVVTNQSGVARGFFLKKDVENLHSYMNKILKKNFTKIDNFLFCPYHIDGKIKKFKKKSNLRKPNNGMFRIAAKKYNIDKKNSFMIGDQITDMQFAKKSGIKGFFFDEINLMKFINRKVLK
jgi:D-glycero-D-manno-heptose 1,7-bisphosphate phosphatase